MQYLENELRNLCPLNPIQTPEKNRWVQNELRHLWGQKPVSKILKPVLIIKPFPDLRHPCASQTWRFSRLRGLAVAHAFRNRLLSSSSSPCLTCAIYVVWNCLETGPILGAYFCFRKGDAPSMWHILVRLVYGCLGIWGSCAIYVGIPNLILANEWELRHLCPKKAAWCWGKINKYGCKPAQKIAKNRSFLGTYMAQLSCFEWELSHLSPAFCIWHRWRNSRFWAIYF